MTLGRDNPIGDCLGRIAELDRRVAALERGRSVEDWEDGPRRNPAPMMGERGERVPLRASQEPQDARSQVEVTDGLGECRRFSTGTGAALRELPCDPTGTDPFPAVSPAESSFAVFTGSGRWEP